MKTQTNLLRLLMFIQNREHNIGLWLNKQRLVVQFQDELAFFRLVGKGCQIAVPAKVWYSAAELVEPAPAGAGTMFRLTSAGQAALAQLRQPQEPSLVKGKRRGRTPDPAPIIDHQSPPHRSP